MIGRQRTHRAGAILKIGTRGETPSTIARLLSALDDRQVQVRGERRRGCFRRKERNDARTRIVIVVSSLSITAASVRFQASA